MREETTAWKDTAALVKDDKDINNDDLTDPNPPEQSVGLSTRKRYPAQKVSVIPRYNNNIVWYFDGTKQLLARQIIIHADKVEV